MLPTRVQGLVDVGKYGDRKLEGDPFPEFCIYFPILKMGWGENIFEGEMAGNSEL